MAEAASAQLPLLEIGIPNQAPSTSSNILGNNVINAASPQNIFFDLESIPDAATIGAKQTGTVSTCTKAVLITATLVVVVTAVCVPAVYYSLNGQASSKTEITTVTTSTSTTDTTTTATTTTSETTTTATTATTATTTSETTTTTTSATTTTTTSETTTTTTSATTTTTTSATTTTTTSATTTTTTSETTTTATTSTTTTATTTTTTTETTTTTTTATTTTSTTSQTTTTTSATTTTTTTRTTSTTATTTTTTAPCLTGYTRTPSGSCVNLLIDFNNCGSIGHVCASTYTSCSNGACSGAPAVQLTGAVAIAGWGGTVSVDDAYMTLSLPFSISLYGYTTSSASVQSNGCICLAGCSSAYSNSALPSGSFSGATAFGYWDDLYIYAGTSQTVYYDSKHCIVGLETTYRDGLELITTYFVEKTLDGEAILLSKQLMKQANGIVINENNTIEDEQIDEKHLDISNENEDDDKQTSVKEILKTSYVSEGNVVRCVTKSFD
ncbi:unnamed protein product [Rotaria sordida]|uniref:Uncharacterized protein n=1 Tax=Rotaria sordida TaxID=392033 RepID=A0A819CV11_9BILA|nr:unnamed protein product [Rotaria sordida]CAF3825700.1 unnamed protein product [Rotaria sordida]